MPFSHLPHDVAAWSSVLASAPVYVAQADTLLPREHLPVQGGYLVLMGEFLSREQLAVVVAQLQSLDIAWALVPPFVLAEVQVLVLALDRYDAELALWLKAQEWPLDAAHVAELPNFAEPGLILMDMDSTAIQIECIDEIARLAGVGEQVSAVTAAAMQGKLEFADSLRNRVALLKDAPISILDAVAANMPLMPGLTLLVDGAKAAGWKVAIASGGFTRFAGKLQQDLGLDHIEANNLETDGELLTGQVLGRIVDAKVKAETLQLLQTRYGIGSAQTVAIGDGANDLPMLKVAGLGVAIHAKPIVREQAQVAIRQLDLEAVLCLLHAGARVAALR
ncbi:phosphoserine phosphatase SerB [Pseudaeromonas pectinilytica]